jgi:hypothetical protein
MGRICSTRGRDECVKKFWFEKLKGRDHSEGRGVDGRVILEWILGKWDGKIWTGFILLIGTSGGLL